MALTRDNPRSFDYSEFTALIAASAIYEGGATCAVRATGLAVGGAFSSATHRFAGFAKTGAASGARVTLEPKGRVILTVAGAVAASANAVVFASDDNTFTVSPAATDVAIGRIAWVEDNGKCVVDFDAASEANQAGMNADGTALVGSDGIPIPIPAIVDAGVATSTLILAAGERNSLALASGYYRVDPDMDVYVKGSNASSKFGAELTADTDGYSTTAGTLAAQTGLSFGTASFTLEAWVQINATTPNGCRLFSVGGQGGTAGTGKTQLDFLATSTGANTALALDLQLTGPDGVAVEPLSTETQLAAYPLGSTLYHIVCTIARGGASATGTATWYVNGAQVLTDTWTEAATVVALNLATNDGSTSRITLGATVGANAEWDGRIEDIKLYTALLTLAQVQARNNAGPLRAIGTDAADSSLTWWINFQQSATWANPLHPQCVSGYGNAVFNSLIGSPAITERTLGAAAASTDNKIYAGKPELVGLTNTYMGFYSDSLSAGSVRLTKVA